MSLNDDRPEGAESRQENGAEEKNSPPSSWNNLRNSIKTAGAATDNTRQDPERHTEVGDRGEEPTEKLPDTTKRSSQTAERRSEVRRSSQTAEQRTGARRSSQPAEQRTGTRRSSQTAEQRTGTRRVSQNSGTERRQRVNREPGTGAKPRSSAEAQRMRARKRRKSKKAQQMRIIVLAAAALLVLLVILLIFGIRGCLSKRNASKDSSVITAEATGSGGVDTTETTAEEVLPTPTPEPTEPPIPPKPDIDINSWEYILANATHSIQDYAPEVAQFEDVMLDYRIIDAMQAFVDGARNQGLSVIMTSGYRDYYTQTSLFEAKVAEYGEEEAATIVAPPGTSEHQTGLAADITDDYYEYMNESLENTELFKWMSAHCHEYGFIVRFPKGKEDITGIMYEPWHYRYVGVEAATYIMENNLTLEEFVELYK